MDGVDIFLPSFNHARFLKQRIESILNQTHARFNLYVFDDGSTDNSLEIINDFRSDQRVRQVYLSERPSGSPFGNWHRFRNLINEQFVWIAESDDFSDSKFLEISIEGLRRFPEAGFSVCKSTVIDENQQARGPARDSINESILPVRFEAPYSLYRGVDVVKSEFFDRNPFPNISAILFRSSVLRRHLPSKPSDFLYLGDWSLHQRALFNSQVCIISHELNRWRTHEHTTRHGVKPDNEWVRLMYERMRVLDSYASLVGLSRSAANHGLKTVLNTYVERIGVNSSIQALIERVKTTRESLVVFGAGRIGEHVCEEFNRAGLSLLIKYLVDRSAAAASFYLLGHQVLSPEVLQHEDRSTLIVVATVQFRSEVVESLHLLNPSLTTFNLSASIL